MERWWDGLAWAEFRRQANSPTTRRVVEREPLVHHPDDATRALSVIVGSPVWVGGLYWLVSMASVPLLVRMPEPIEWTYDEKDDQPSAAVVDPVVDADEAGAGLPH